MTSLTPRERRVFMNLVMAWNAFLELPTEHADDVDEFRRGIHQLQDKILARPVRRAINEEDE